MQKRNATAAVIGAGDYIGAEIAKKFAAEGFTVFAGRRDGAKLEPLVRDIEAAGGSIIARALDARKEEEVTAFLNDADNTRRSKSASSTSAPMSTFRSWRPPTACSARSGKWPAGRALLPVANRRD
jgi:NAD(P)-dependent dehydrogenase (short-subunit alcohol dehydrogenase family)